MTTALLIDIPNYSLRSIEIIRELSHKIDISDASLTKVLTALIQEAESTDTPTEAQQILLNWFEE